MNTAMILEKDLLSPLLSFLIVAVNISSANSLCTNCNVNMRVAFRRESLSTRERWLMWGLRTSNVTKVVIYVRNVSLFLTGRSLSFLSPTLGTQKFLGEITVDVGGIFHVGKINRMCPVVSRYL